VLVGVCSVVLLGLQLCMGFVFKLTVVVPGLCLISCDIVVQSSLIVCCWFISW